jgi:hypothetical protein
MENKNTTCTGGTTQIETTDFQLDLTTVLSFQLSEDVTGKITVEQILKMFSGVAPQAIPATAQWKESLERASTEYSKDFENHDCEKDFINIKEAAKTDFVEGAEWAYNYILQGKEEGERGASPNKEEGDDVASDNKESASVASHTASSGNSNQQ